jgi:hypothetical protein
MIDNPEKTGHLIAQLKESLPVETRLTQTLTRTIAGQSPDLAIPDRCKVTSIFYTGDEGGILCGLNLGGPDTKTPYFVSITHLSFDRRMPLFRQIGAYQRHRIKKLKQQTGPSC